MNKYELFLLSIVISCLIVMSQSLAAEPEICDGIDNNQNGLIDENPECLFEKTFTDDFNDNELNTVMWNFDTDGVIIETNGHLLFSQSQSDTEVSIEADTNCYFAGDFNAKVDFTLLDWPENNSLKIGLNANPQPMFIGADPQPMNVEFIEHWDPAINQNLYLTHFFEGIQGLIPTSDTSGTLILTRRGTVLAGFYFNGNEYVEIGTSTGADSPVNFTLALWSHPNQATTGGQIAFDNFEVTSNEMYCPVINTLYQYSIDQFCIDGNLPGNTCDDFDDGVLWEYVEGTAIESNGVVKLSNPGEIETKLLGNYFITETGSLISTYDSAFQIANGAGDFIASSRWLHSIPKLNHNISLVMHTNDDLGEELDEIRIGIYNLSESLGKLISYGVSSGLKAIFSYESEYPGTKFFQIYPIDPQNISGDIVFRIHFNDISNQFSASFSLDGGSSFLEFYFPLNSHISDASNVSWKLEVVSSDIQQLYVESYIKGLPWLMLLLDD